MDYQEIRQLMTYPAIDLLRSDNAAMVLGFLYRAFKAQHRAVLPEGQLRAMLESYLEELRQSDPEKYPMTSAQYLGTWCDTAHQYLRKYLLEDSDDPQFELTAGSEKALLWLEHLSGTTGFVGTESRLDSIFKGLDDLLLNTTAHGPAVLPSKAGNRAVGVIANLAESGGVGVVEPARIYANSCSLRRRDAYAHRDQLRQIHLEADLMFDAGQVCAIPVEIPKPDRRMVGRTNADYFIDLVVHAPVKSKPERRRLVSGREIVGHRAACGYRSGKRRRNHLEHGQRGHQREAG